MADFVKAALFDGQDPNTNAQVTEAGALKTEPLNEVSISTTKNALTTTSTQIADVDPTRIQIQLQNLDDTNSIHIAFVPSPGDADTDDFRIGPGESYSFPPGWTYTGEIQAIATEADTPYVLLVYQRP
jgi:hypothetical protein